MTTVPTVVTPWSPTVVNLVLLTLHLFLGTMIFAHGYQKVFRGGKLRGTAGWFEGIGMRSGKLNAYVAAATELGVGTLMTLGFLTSLAAAGLVALMIVAIVTVHRKNGFFNFRPGQGVEYNVAVVVMAVTAGTFGAGRYSLDHVSHLLHLSATHGLLVTVLVGVLAAVAQLALFYRPAKQS